MAAVLVGSAQGIIHGVIKGNGEEVVVDTNCKVLDTVVDRYNKVSLKLDCQGQNSDVNDPEVVTSYIKNPGPLTCTVYESGKAKCQARQQNAEVTPP